MNYQNNMGVYYTYNQNKHKEAARKKRNTLISLLGLFLALLLFGWTYFNYFNGKSINNSLLKSSDSKNDTSGEKAVSSNKSAEVNTITNVSGSKEASINDLNITTNILPKKLTELNALEDKELNLSENSTAVSLASNELNSSMKNLSKITKNMNQEVNSSQEKDLVTSTVTLTSTIKELNSSIENTSIITKSITQEANITEEKNTTKVVVEKKLPLTLYHLYIVSAGETITSIAQHQYNDESMALEIIQANPDLENPNNIKEGQELLLPIVNESKSYSSILHFK